MRTVVSWRQAGLIKQLRTYAESRWLPHLLAVLSFVLVTAYYMTPQALHCQTTVYGFGDSTAGVIWRNGVSSDNPLWGPEHATNYPYGEDLSSPVNYIAVLHFTLYWVLAKIAGPICGFNLLNFIGFVATAAAMYGFIHWLTHKKSIAWLAGFAVSFSPYFQNKVGSHSSYGYAAFLILALWLYLRLLRERHWLDVPLLALVLAVCVYWDPYFSLLVATILAPLVVVTVVYSYLQVRGQGPLSRHPQGAVAAAAALCAGGRLDAPLASASHRHRAHQCRTNQRTGRRGSRSRPGKRHHPRIVPISLQTICFHLTQTISRMRSRMGDMRRQSSDSSMAVTPPSITWA